MEFPNPVREEESHTPAMLRMPYQNKTPYMTTTYNRQNDPLMEERLCGGGQTTLAALTGRRRGHLELCVLGHHPLETDANSFDDGQQDGAADGSVADGLGTSTHGERTTGEETGDDCVPRVLLFADAFHGAVECAEHAAPDTEVASEHGRAGLDCCDGCTWRC
jgi:hypothetical protein